MRLIIFLFFVTFTFNAHAKMSIDTFFSSEVASDVCESALTEFQPGKYSKKRVLAYGINDLVYLGSSNYRQDGILEVFSLTKEARFVFQTFGEVRQVLRHNGKTLILTHNGIQDIYYGNENQTLKPTANIGYEGKYSEPRSMVIIDNKIYVAHGSLGLSVLDTETLKVIKTIPMADFKLNKPGYRSMITGITIIDNNLVVAVDDVTLHTKGKAFEGFLKLDPKTLKTVETNKLNSYKEGYYLPRLFKYGHGMIMQNLHILQVFYTHKIAQPNKRLWSFEGFEIMGTPHINDNKAYGCFINNNGNRPVVKAGVYSL